MASSADKMAADIMRQQRDAAENTRRRYAEESRQQRLALRSQVTAIIPKITAALPAHANIGMVPIDLWKHSSWGGKSRSKPRAAWKLASVTWDWKETTLTSDYYLLADGQIAKSAGLGGSISVTTLDDCSTPLLLRILAGLQSLATTVGVTS